MIILAQVSFSQFLEAKGGTRKEDFSRFAEVRQKVADFLVCSKGLDIIACVELDDRSHNKEKDKARDAFLAEAGIHTIRWNVKNQPSKLEIQKAIGELEYFKNVN